LKRIAALISATLPGTADASKLRQKLLDYFRMRLTEVVNEGERRVYLSGPDEITSVRLRGLHGWMQSQGFQDIKDITKKRDATGTVPSAS